jgi:hypothetical protein
MAYSLRALPLSVLPWLILAAQPVSAQVNDYSITQLRVMQIIEGGALVGARPVTIRTMIDVSGPNNPPASIDGLLRIFVDGVEAPDSPAYSLNGPVLVDTDSVPDESNSMLNFAYIPPVSTDVVFVVELNPPGPNFVPETNTTNNTATSASLLFREQELLTLMYSPIDYRPSGGSTPNLPDNDLIKPGVGDGFVQGIFAGGMMEYRRTGAPSKLWTSSLSGSGSSLISSLITDLLLTNPQPDYIYGWVQGGLPYNGMAFLNNVGSMGNTQNFRHQRTYAHELGHNFGLSHNSLVNNVYGEDVERHLNDPLGLPKVKKDNLLDIMVPGQFTTSAWVHPNSFNSFLNHPDLSLPGTDLDSSDTAEPRLHLLVSGRWHRGTGELTLAPVLSVLAEQGSRAAAPAQADLVLQGLVDGEIVREFLVSARSSGDDGACAEAQLGSDQDSDQPSDPVIHFAVLMPAQGVDGRSIQGLVVTGTGTHPAQSIQRLASANAPEVSVLSPTDGASTGSQVTLRWEVSDADGDELTTTVRYVPDGMRHIVPLVTHTQATELTVDLSGLPHFVSGQGHFELLVSDGFRTTRARSSALTGPGAYAGAGGELPFIDIYHPDDSTNFRKGASLILHSSGWDLEDDALTGNSIEWSSDVDGDLGTGRRFIVTGLSVGAHQITATATDSGGQQTSVTHGITVNDRELPDVFVEICALDLGNGGPGTASVSLCGEDLTAGGSADLELVGGPANAPVFLVLGLVNGSLPIKGGTLVPFPWVSLTALQTNGLGEISIPGVTSGGVPVTLFLQYVLVDAGQPSGFGFSNALQVEF